MHMLCIKSPPRAIAAVALLASSTWHAAVAAPVQTDAAVAVTRSFAYTSFGGGDFVFTTSVGAAGCESGWYVKATDPGFKAAVATVLTAQASGKSVFVYGDNADLWSGSSGHYCRLQTVALIS